MDRRQGWRSPRFAAAASIAAAVVLIACRHALGTVLDLPPPAPKPPPQVVQVVAATPLEQEDTLPPPPIERVRQTDSVLQMLPRDNAGNVDWVAALKTGVIRPRPVPPGGRAPRGQQFQFAYDFVFPGPDTTFDAYFPHSVHTEWASCQQCHPRIFPYRGTPIKMADVFTGKYCGECHGKVSFPVLTGCERCHTRLKMPPNRAKPELIGTVQMRRASQEAKGATLGGLPEASFPHWAHRIRFQCKACHLEIFEPRAGANVVTMAQIGSGQACGRCHDGATAFAVGIESCVRCHVAPAAASP